MGEREVDAQVMYRSDGGSVPSEEGDGAIDLLGE